MCDNYYFIWILNIFLLLILTGCSEDNKRSRVDAQCVTESMGTYPDQQISLYILPWRVGETYLVGQGNCTTTSHNAETNSQFAYDFAMPIGTTIQAARGGVVFKVEESFVDGNGASGQSNFVIIEHDDGTFGIYGHLTSMGALVESGEVIEQGHVIGLSGSTGTTEPHLHFEVSIVDDTSNIVSVSARITRPVTFRNTSAHPNGLIENTSYRAL